MKKHSLHPIVCGTDFSEAAAQAGNVAAAISMRLDTSLLLVHGVDERGEIPAFYWPAMIESLRPQLRKEAERLRKLGARVEETMSGGAPEDGVACFAERADARLIVLASTGHGSPARWMLGSISERIAESAWVPTLVVREGTRLEDWARGGKPLRVFVGADFTSNSDAAMNWAAALSEIGPCEFTVGYVDRLAEERAEMAKHAPSDMPCAAEMQQLLVHDLRRKAESHFPQQPIQIRVLPASGQVDSHLLELAGEAGAEIIVVGTHQWHGLSRLRHPSVSRRILHTARTSVACVPAHHVVSASSKCSSKAHRVLVATDLSTHGGRAIPYAFSMLQAGGTAWLLHVSKPGEEREPQLAQLSALIPTEALRQGFQVKVEVVESHDVATAICDAAQRFDADVICLGSRGPIKRVAGALGSTVSALILRSTRPVLLVPDAHAD